MALHKNFPRDKFVILEPEIRWFPADEALREQGYEKLLPPFVPELRKRVKDWRAKNYEGVSPNMFDEDWLRLVIKMATGSGKTKVMSLPAAQGSKVKSREKTRVETRVETREKILQISKYLVN